MPNPSPQLTLVVAATLCNGIGTKGALPWRLSKEMAYFAKVTREGGPPSSAESALNVVVMGRKTWESVPLKFRPLKGRLNVVISNSMGSIDAAKSSTEPPPQLVSSFEESLSKISSLPTHNVFVIGGASIYTQALQYPSTTRILLTRILEPAYEECDVFFPDFQKSGDWTQAGHDELEKWVGFEVPNEVQEENKTKYEYQMWVRKAEESS